MTKILFNKKNYLILSIFLVISIYALVQLSSINSSRILPKNETATNTTITQENYEIIPHKVYYVLLREEFESENNNMGVLVRVYLCYDGVINQRFPHTDKIAIDTANSLSQVKERLISQSDTKALQLRPYTIVSSQVISQWKKEGYTPTYEYHKESPEGLTYESLLKL